MIRTAGMSGLLATILTFIVAIPAFGWHVDTGKDHQTVTFNEATATAKAHGPKGDPWFRFVVKSSPASVKLGTCTGWVKVPNQSWANGTTFTVDGTNVAIGKGEKAHLPAGSYVGRWSNSNEVERFTIRCERALVPAVLPDNTVKFTIRIVGRNGVRKITRSMSGGCTYKSPWLYAKPQTRMWVNQKQPEFSRLLTRNSGAGGYFGPLYRGYDIGISC
jgi:hypothetical protein